MWTRRVRKVRRTKKAPLKANASPIVQAANFIQFSKKITVYILAYWGLYRLVQLVVGIIRPEMADALVKLSAGIDGIAIAFGTGYTINSIGEKAMNMHTEVQKYLYSSSDDSKEESVG